MGLAFGFFLKRSRLCLSASLRDIYVEKKLDGLWWFLFIILTTSVIYFSLIALHVIPEAAQVPFSVSSEIIGGLFFGFGAAMCSGCITTAMIKIGDGRITGLIAALSFMLIAVATKQGPLSPLNNQLQQSTLTSANYTNLIRFNPLFLLVPLFVIFLFVIYKQKLGQANSYLSKFQKHSSKTKISDYLLRQRWNPFITAAILGIIAGLSFYFSYQTGRYGSVATLGPLISWQNFFGSAAVKLDWGELFVVGLILGSFTFTFSNKEFTFKNYSGKDIMLSFVGGCLMGFGAVVGNGCILANGIVGNAMLSLESLINIIFITFGLWIGSYFLYIRPMSREINNEN